MNLEIFKKSDPSGILYKEKYLSKHYTEEYDFIIDYFKSLEIEDMSFKEKVYLCLNHLKDIPKCKKEECNNKTKYKNSTLGYNEYCSNKCISSDPNIKKHKEELSILKFGTKTPSESDEVKNKIKKTNNEKYGGNSPMSSKETQKKSTETLLKNYGVDHVTKSPELMSKRIESFKESNYKESYTKTSMERYGTHHPWANEEIHKKTIEHFYKDYKDRILDKIKNTIYTFVNFEYKPSNLILHCSECNSNFNILPYQFYYRIGSKNPLCTNCYPIDSNSSLLQIRLEKYIETLGLEIITNTNKIIYPYEIDIYIPSLNIGIEFNGVYWHSELFKDKNYHLKKYNKSIERNIKLITIWEDDYVFKEEIVNSFISNKLNKTKNKIYARNCAIKLVSNKDSRTFLINNHLQGDCNSSIKLGLYHNNILISLMSFSNLRVALSQKNSNKLIFELTRFCNLINFNIIGGASKLLNYFINNYNPLEIHTYSDNCISDGNLYEKLGFEYIHTSKPGYWYVINDKREHRYNWTKSKLVSLGYDKEKSESEIMSELGHNKVYGIGNKKWIYYNKSINN